MTHDELMALEDVSSWIDYEERVLPGGSRVIVPVQKGFAGALFQKNEDGEFRGPDGDWWFTGWIGDRHVRQRRTCWAHLSS